MNRPRLVQPGHPDRSLSVEEVIEPGYQALVLRMMQKGMSEQEIVLAIESLAQAHLDTLSATVENEDAIDRALVEAGMKPCDRQPVRDGWMISAGALIWAALIATSIMLTLQFMGWR